MNLKDSWKLYHQMHRQWNCYCKDCFEIVPDYMTTFPKVNMMVRSRVMFLK